MKKIILLLTLYLVAENILAQNGNVGIGTNSPQQKLHVAGGNVLIEDGIVTRSATGVGKDLLPVAIATIGSNGVVTGGTTNVSCTKDGNEFIVDIGKKNNDCQAFISLLPGIATRYEVFKMTGSNDTKLRIILYNSNNVEVSSGFNLLVFKAGNDPHHEYNITVATNVNALRIGHGYHGIVAYGVDSITINITILSDVTIGGPDPDTANGITGSISITDIPCPAKITIPSLESFTVSAEVLDKYVGVYSTTQAPVKLRITREGTTLFFQPPNEDKPVALEATAEDKFNIGNAVFFEFDAAKNQMIIKRGGNERVFTKDK